MGDKKDTHIHNHSLIIVLLIILSSSIITLTGSTQILQSLIFAQNHNVPINPNSHCTPRTGTTEYGCYCGLGSSCTTGFDCPPVDAIDEACRQHDISYSSRNCSIISNLNPFGNCYRIVQEADSMLCRRAFDIQANSGGGPNAPPYLIGVESIFCSNQDINSIVHSECFGATTCSSGRTCTNGQCVPSSSNTCPINQIPCTRADHSQLCTAAQYGFCDTGSSGTCTVGTRDNQCRTPPNTTCPDGHNAASRQDCGSCGNDCGAGRQCQGVGIGICVRDSNNHIITSRSVYPIGYTCVPGGVTNVHDASCDPPY